MTENGSEHAQLLEEVQRLRERVTELERDESRPSHATRTWRVDRSDISRHVFASACDAITVFDVESAKCVDVNDTALKLYGYARSEFLGLSHADVTLDAEDSRISTATSVTSDTRSTRPQYHRKKDGTVFSVDVSASTFKLGQRTMFCSMVRDVGQRDLAELKPRDSEDRNEEPPDRIPNTQLINATDIRDLD